MGSLGFSGPQTVLKTAGLSSATVRQRALEFRSLARNSAAIRLSALSIAPVAVSVAVMNGCRGSR